MPKFRRYYVPGAIVFVTAVTHGRLPVLQAAEDIDVFWKTLRNVRKLHPFRLLAYVILPDHLHWLIRVDDQSGDFSAVMHSVKWNYTYNYKKAHGVTEPLTLWQSRFWDHVIRDQRDLNAHLNYIHWNPVKHEHVERPEDWPHSSFRHWLERGYYEPGWSCKVEPAGVSGPR